jgi:hypothetical protein
MTEHVLRQRLQPIPIGWSMAGQPRTFRITRPDRNPGIPAAYRGLAVAILALDVRTLAANLARGRPRIP